MHDQGQTGDPPPNIADRLLRNRAPSPSVIRDDVEHGSPVAVHAPHSGVRSCLDSAERAAGHRRSSWRPLPARGVPHARGDRGRWPGPSDRTGRGRDPSGHGLGNRRLPSRAGRHRLRRDPGAAVRRGLPHGVRRPGADLHLRDACGPGADLVVRGRHRSPRPALRRCQRHARCGPPPELTGAKKRDTDRWHVTRSRATLTAE